MCKSCKLCVEEIWLLDNNPYKQNEVGSFAVANVTIAMHSHPEDAI